MNAGDLIDNLPGVGIHIHKFPHFTCRISHFYLINQVAGTRHTFGESFPEYHEFCGDDTQGCVYWRLRGYVGNGRIHRRRFC